MRIGLRKALSLVGLDGRLHRRLTLPTVLRRLVLSSAVKGAAGHGLSIALHAEGSI